jgi:hypothetical protein
MTKNRLRVLGLGVLGSRFWVQRFWVQGSGFKVLGSRFSPAVGHRTASQIDNETLKKRITNIEQEIMNVEVGILSIYINLK